MTSNRFLLRATNGGVGLDKTLQQIPRPFNGHLALLAEILRDRRNKGNGSNKDTYPGDLPILPRIKSIDTRIQRQNLAPKLQPHLTGLAAKLFVVRLEFAADWDVPSDMYMKRFEDTVRDNPQIFPLLSKYYH